VLWLKPETVRQRTLIGKPLQNTPSSKRPTATATQKLTAIRPSNCRSPSIATVAVTESHVGLVKNLMEIKAGADRVRSTCNSV
jgi:hypothetical protein